jgi:hypothetical protein
MGVVWTSTGFLVTNGDKRRSVQLQKARIRDTPNRGYFLHPKAFMRSQPTPIDVKVVGQFIMRIDQAARSAICSMER